MIEIVSPSPQWTEEFTALARDLRAALGERALRIDHIGSTSVPGLAAKDRIDIQVTVESLDDLDPIVEAITGLGYRYYSGEIWIDHLPPGWEGPPEAWKKILFSSWPGQRAVNIHVRVSGSPNARYAVLFRDFLRVHPAMAAGYAAFKKGLAAYMGGDTRTYADLKDPVCDIIMAAAEEWATETGWEIAPTDRED
jgi:GrpB-like predicted nucleotidyltransferase (UPF0157 family)